MGSCVVLGYLGYVACFEGVAFQCIVTPVVCACARQEHDWSGLNPRPWASVDVVRGVCAGGMLFTA